MPVKVRDRTGDTIPLHALKDSELAVIVEENSPYKGNVVQMIDGYGVERRLQIVGGTAGKSWSGSPSIECRLLKPGDVLEITK